MWRPELGKGDTFPGFGLKEQAHCRFAGLAASGMDAIDLEILKWGFEIRVPEVGALVVFEEDEDEDEEDFQVLVDSSFFTGGEDV